MTQIRTSYRRRDALCGCTKLLLGSILQTDRIRKPDFDERLGFTDANGSPDPNDYNQHGSIFV
jgi:hypothetical protein